MSTETTQTERPDAFQTPFRLLVENCQNSDPLRREIIDRFEELEKERARAVARAEQAEQARDAAEATIAALRGGRSEGAQHAEVPTVQDMFERLRRVHGQDAKSLREEIIARCKRSVQERDEAVAALAAERAATKTSTVALRAELDALIAEIDRARRERREIVAENLRVANMVSDMRARINQLQEENLLLKRQLSAQEAATLAAEQRASAVPSSAAPSDLLARLEEAERSASAWQEVASGSADELRRARYIIAVQASRIDDFQRRQPTEPEPPTQDSP